ncbi:MAG: ABC transporter substrate-binding protein [Streptosporangiales bacterium]|nr:ABC transporter substrate-binding protein [Streptosporangiales bacterium]
MRIPSTFAAGAALLLLAACGAQSDAGDNGSGPIEVGLIVPETGAFGSVAGEQFLEATKVVVEEWNNNGGINGREIKLEVCNDESTAEKSISCYRSLSPKVDLMLGPHIGLTYNAVSSLAERADQLLVTATPHAFPNADSTVFESAVPAEYAITKGFEFLSGQGFSKIGMLTGNDETGQTAHDAAAKDAESLGGKVQLSAETFDVAARDVTAQVAKLKADGVDAVFVWSTGAVVATILRDIARSGLDVPVLLNYSNLSYGLMGLVPADAVPADLYFTGTKAFAPTEENPDQKALIETFSADYLKATQKKADFNAFAAADAAQTAFTAVKATKSTSGKELKKWLESGDPVAAFNFVFSFSSDNHVGGTDPDQVEIVKWNGTGWDPVG